MEFGCKIVERVKKKFKELRRFNNWVLLADNDGNSKWICDKSQILISAWKAQKGELFNFNLLACRGKNSDHWVNG